MTNTPQSEYVAGTGSGTCSGTLTVAGSAPRRIRAAPAKLAAQSHGTEACEEGRGKGSGALTLDGHTIKFTYSELRAGPVLALTATGAAGGSAVAQGNISPNSNPVAILEACAAGGLSQAPIDIRLATAVSISG